MGDVDGRRDPHPISNSIPPRSAGSLEGTSCESQPQKRKAYRSGSRDTQYVNSDEMSKESAALADLERAAIEWAATSQGQALVDACVDALVAGLDSPTLRVLAGAPAISANDEATDLGPRVFEELDLTISDEQSDEAYLQLARTKAQELLNGHGTERQLTTDLYTLYRKSQFRLALAEFSGLDDWYHQIEDGVLKDNPSTVADAVVLAARDFLESSGYQEL